MALTQIDPVAALVVIDMQKGIVALSLAHPAAEVAARVARLARGFREKKLPVVLVNVAGAAPGRTDVKRNFSPPPDWAELDPRARSPGFGLHGDEDAGRGVLRHGARDDPQAACA